VPIQHLHDKTYANPVLYKRQQQMQYEQSKELEINKDLARTLRSSQNHAGQ
jgi:hypothetical protein